jgi:hypothetical protein
MTDTFEIPFLGKVMFEAMTATANRILPSFSGRFIDSLHIGIIFAFQLAMGLDVALQAVICFKRASCKMTRDLEI